MRIVGGIEVKRWYHTGDTLPYFTIMPLLKLKRQKIKTNYDIYKITVA